MASQTQTNQTMKDKVTEKAVVVFKDLQNRSTEAKDRAIVLVRDPQFQMCTVTSAGGAITFGAVGGAFGLASGVVVGSAAGVVPALLTFGLSIPVGGAIGGAGGLCTGTLIGGTSGGVAGFSAYKYRIVIKNGVLTVKVKAYEAFDNAKSKAVLACSSATKEAKARVYKFQVKLNDIACQTKKTSIEKASEAYNFATTTKVGVTSSSAIAGAVVGGTTTGALGYAAGAVVGIVPAIFTFGLSIPIGAVIGLCAGTAVGGSVGAVGGGAIGYTSFTHGKAIKNSVRSNLDKASTKVEDLKVKAFARAAEAKESVQSVIRGSTGGSAQSSDTEIL